MLLLQAHEPARLNALAGYGIIGSGREGAFDELVAIARKRFDAPISAISFVDEHRWWPKAISGFARCSLPRGVTFCDLALAANDVFEISDTLADERFARSPLVDSWPRIRFYAGVAVRDSLGYALGTFSIFDDQPRHLDAADAESLREFARLAFQLVELRRAARRGDEDRVTLKRLTRSLALLEAILTAVSEAADLETALLQTARRIGELAGWIVRGVWRPGADLDGPLPAQASVERRTVLDGDGASVAIPVLAGDEVVAVLQFDVGTHGSSDSSLLAAVAGVVQPLGALVRRRRIEEQLRASELKLRSVTESARDGIVTLARDGTIVYANPAARVMFGRDEMRGLPMQRLVTGIGFDGREGGEPMERWALHASGRRFPVELSYAEWAVDKSGYVTAIVRDVSERFEAQAEAEAAQRRLAFLFRATSELLEQPLSTEALLATVTGLVLPQLGDFCIVDLVEGEQQLRRVACSPDRGQEAIALNGSPAFAPCGDSLVARVMRTGAPFCFSPTDAGEAGGALDVATAHQWARAGWRACLIVPLIARNRTVGAITLVSFGRGFGKDDLALAQELGHRVALAVDNAHLYDEAREAVRVRDDVLAIVSHDLRNPLSTILTSTGRMLESIEDEERLLRAPLERCQRAARRMTHMISDLVDAASLETGTLSLDQKDNELARVMNDALDLLQPLADARGLKLTTEERGGALRAFCDRERVVQVLSNVVGNAIKFTPGGGSIRVVAEAWGDMVRVSVSDDGPGIPADQIPRIFDRYWHSATRESRQGAGLGLYIAKGIVENHGGRIWVDSALGLGSTFYFTLPAAAAPMEAHASN
jgi:PAS domain S-box-containing protein